MKQNLSRGRNDARLLLLVAFAVMFISCAKQQPRSPATTDLSALSVATVDASGSSRLNINTAAATELEKLPGVGKIMAERIIVYRQQYGPFRRVEHLMMVHGLSDHKFRALHELITVE
jgi:competence protein ComEA